jgi:hypothetical protein
VRREATTLDAALEAALDARRDPLFDEAVLDALVSEPERFGEALRLSRGVHELARAPRTVAHAGTRRSLRRHVLLTLVALLLIGVAFSAWWSKPDRAEHQPTDDGIVDAQPVLPVTAKPAAVLAPTSARERITSLVLSVEVAQGDDVRRTALVANVDGSRHVVESASRRVNGRIEQIVTSQTPLP